MKLAVNTMRNLPVILTCLVLGGCNGDNSSSIQPIDVTDTQPFQSRHALTASNPTLDSCISNEEVIVKPHVVNIVSETAHAELLAALNAPSRGIPAKAAEVFYRYFPDDFDFLQFDVAGAPVSAVPFGAFFNAVKRPPIPALGFDTSRDTSRFFSTSRLKGVITATDSVAGRTATVHELFHYNDCTGFKETSGFPYTGIGHCKGTTSSGETGELYRGPYSAFTSDFYTPLGEWQCADQQNTSYPCSPDANGKYSFTNVTIGLPESYIDSPLPPFELYMLGLKPIAEVPDEMAFYRFNVDSGVDSAGNIDTGGYAPKRRKTTAVPGRPCYANGLRDCVSGTCF